MDAHSFTVGADYRAYSATTTGLSGGATGTLRDVIALNSTTVLEADEDEAVMNAPKFAGTVPAAAGTYYVRQFNAASLPGTTRPFYFYVRALTGSPIPKAENVEGTPPAPRSNGWRSRVIGPATAKDDAFAITVDGGDTIGVIVCVDLERGAPEWNLIPRIGVFTGCFIMINGGKNLYEANPPERAPRWLRQF